MRILCALQLLCDKVYVPVTTRRHDICVLSGVAEPDQDDDAINGDKEEEKAAPNDANAVTLDKGIRSCSQLHLCCRAAWRLASAAV